jgi:hypothetical protein
MTGVYTYYTIIMNTAQTLLGRLLENCTVSCWFSFGFALEDLSEHYSDTAIKQKHGPAWKTAQASFGFWHRLLVSYFSETCSGTPHFPEHCRHCLETALREPVLWFYMDFCFGSYFLDTRKATQEPARAQGLLLGRLLELLQSNRGPSLIGVSVGVQLRGSLIRRCRFKDVSGRDLPVWSTLIQGAVGVPLVGPTR